ncbi:hypothetical protein AAHC03_04662 [Spirometra sp. Aus1]
MEEGKVVRKHWDKKLAAGRGFSAEARRKMRRGVPESTCSSTRARTEQLTTRPTSFGASAEGERNAAREAAAALGRAASQS